MQYQTTKNLQSRCIWHEYNIKLGMNGVLKKDVNITRNIHEVTVPEITHSIDKMCVFYQSEKSCHIYGYGSVDESMNFIKEKCESFYRELKKQ